MCFTCVNIKELCILTTDCTYEVCVILITSGVYLFDSIIQLIFVTETPFILSEVEIKFRNVI